MSRYEQQRLVKIGRGHAASDFVVSTLAMLRFVRAFQVVERINHGP